MHRITVFPSSTDETLSTDNIDLKDKTTLFLAQRLNEIMKEQNQHELSILMLDEEFNEIKWEELKEFLKYKKDYKLFQELFQFQNLRMT